MAVSFTNASLHAIESFAERAGIVAIPARDGTFSFTFERSGTLSFVPTDDSEQLIIFMKRTPRYPDPDRELKALKLAGDDRSTRRTLHAGVTAEGAIVLSFVLDNSDIDVPTVLACIDRLISAQDELG
ncbi:CesT family type III secretion system chaperone [Pseudochelatococcus sp. B33]